MGLLKNISIIILIVLAGCNKNTDSVKTFIDSPAGQLIKNKILALADTVDILSIGSVKQESLAYTQNDYSFYVSRFIRSPRVSLYIENGSSHNLGKIENRYYLQDGQVVLLVNNMYNSNSAVPYKTTRTFYQNGDPLFSDRMESASADSMQNNSFKENDTPYPNASIDLKKLNDAIYQRGPFDLVFQGITEYPKAKYLVLSKNNFNAYQAAILISKEDEFIKAVQINPEKFRGRKMEIRWRPNKPGGEVVYLSGNLR